MDILVVLALFGLVFAAIFSLLVRRVWMRFRMIAIAVPAGSDPQAFHYKLTEAIRSFGYRPDPGAGPSAGFCSPGWQKWAVGLQDISVLPDVGGAVLITGPALNVSRIGKVFTGVTAQPYNGRQPVWPLIKGCIRIFAVLLVLLAACGLAAYLTVGP